MLTQYQTGVIHIEQGSATVYGVGTSWLTYANVGDVMHILDDTYSIIDITSINTLVLDRPYSGQDADNLNYIIMKG